MPSPIVPAALSLLAHPYRELRPVDGGRRQLKEESRSGSALVWQLGGGIQINDIAVARDRPGGVALIVVLPQRPDVGEDQALLQAMDAVRPLGILPYHQVPSVSDLLCLLRRPPEDLAAEITDYLTWRGIAMDRETARLVRKTITLSAELRSVSALSRSLYLSRRALGRRFLSRGIPVPSHWLHFGRILRVAIRLQNSEDSVLSIGYDLGYPDAFSLSNQMVRLTGFRPSDAREYLGWEWLLEAWLRIEADGGGLAPEYTAGVLDARGVGSESVPSAPHSSARPQRRASAARRRRAAG